MNTKNRNNNETYKSEIVDFLQSRINPVAIYIYGSFLSSRFNDESDIDIAIITPKKIDTLTLYNLSTELSFITKRDIHLVDFLSVSDVLRIEILKNKLVIFTENEEQRLFHEMNALTSYVKLNEEREMVIKARYGEAAWTLL